MATARVISGELLFEVTYEADKTIKKGETVTVILPVVVADVPAKVSA